jgi:hypothetical protein
MTSWATLLVWAGAWILLILSLVWLGARRARSFDATLDRFGCRRTDPEHYDGEIIGSPGAVVNSAVRAEIAGTPLTFLFASVTGDPVAWEGVFHAPRVSVIAALVRATDPPRWIDTWTTAHATGLGWRPASASGVLHDGTTLLVWEGCGEHGPTFQRLCLALARTPRPGPTPSRAISDAPPWQ